MFIAKDLGPVGELQVGGDDQGHAFVESGTELEHELSAGGRKRDEAEFVQDNQVVLESGSQEFRQAMLLLSQEQFVDQGGGVVKATR